MREWTRIGFSSIYLVLNQLREKDFVTQKAQIVNGKSQNQFELTPTGKKILAEQIFSSITTVEKLDDPFDMGISNTVGVQANTVVHLLTERIHNLQSAVNQLQIKKQYQQESGIPQHPSIMILFDRTLAAWESEISFLENYRQKYQEPSNGEN